MTGGAFGSMIAQLFHLTAAERKTLLVAGAAAGMSATFASPVAAVLLAVELLLFELKPRSLVPVALASAAAAVVRRYILGAGPLFPVPDVDIAAATAPTILFSCIFVGLAAGALSALLTAAVYAAEDVFAKLKKLHWMWWPALGGRGRRRGRPRLPAGAGRRLRSDPVAPPRRRRPGDDGPPHAGEGDDLGGVARLGHLGRRAGAAPHDGERARRAGVVLSPRARRRLLAASSAWRRSWPAPCARR